MKEEVYRIFNPENRRHEAIEPKDFEPGMVVMVLYWSKTLNRYASVPGLSLYQVRDDLTLKNVDNN